MPFPTFEVDKKGLAKLLEKRGKEFVLYELIQNAWDEETKNVNVTVQSIGKGIAEIIVQDDNPEGFKDLRHAYTLFAESSKKDNPEQRGRFNLGEKLVVAVAREAEVMTTKGFIGWDDVGRRHNTKRCTEEGTIFRGTFRMTKDEVERVVAQAQLLIPPAGVITTINKQPLPTRQPKHTFEATVATEIADAEGYLRPTRRKTRIEVYEPQVDEVAMLYEMGIPVVPTNDRWHVNVLQKVPLNTDRDNVTPAYLSQLRALTLNEMAAYIDKDSATDQWVNVALAHPDVKPEAVERVLTERFGEKRVIYDPSDPEGSKIAAAEGYTVIPPRSFNRDQWANIKGSGSVLPAGQVTPSPKVYEEGLEIRPESVITDWTQDMKDTAVFAKKVSSVLLGFDVSVRIVREPHVGWLASYGGKGITLNLGKLGHKFFASVGSDRQLELFLHEFAHEDAHDHLDRHFADEVARLGVKLAHAMQRGEL